MRFMIMVKASRDTEAGVMPEEALLKSMAKFHEELAAAGALLDASGLDWRGAARVAREINHSSGRAQQEALSKAEARWHVIPAGSGH